MAQTHFRERPVFIGNAGLRKDIPPLLVVTNENNKVTGWVELDNCIVYNEQLISLGGWQPFDNPALTGMIVYGDSFRKLGGSRFTLVGTLTKLYYFNTSTNGFSSFATGLNTTSGWRWQHADMADARLLTNGVDAIQFFISNSSYGVLSGDASQPAAAKFIINFANHVLCGYVKEGSTTYHQRVRWSDLASTTIWAPATSNEAGSYDLGEDAGEITGLGLVSQTRCAIYKPEAIYLIAYTGGESVMSFERVVSGVGCWYPYSLVNVRNTHYFCGRDDFYVWSGVGVPKGIGAGKIRTFFMNDVLQDTPHCMYGWAHPELPLIYWVYTPKTANTLNYSKCLIYNWETGEWAMRSSFPHSALWTHFLTGNQTIAQLTGSISELSGDIAHIGGSVGVRLTMSGNSSGVLFSHGLTDNANGQPLTRLAETGQLAYGTLHGYKFADRTQFELGLTEPLGTVTATLYGRNIQTDDATVLATKVLSATQRFDYRAHAKLFSYKILTTTGFALTGFSTRVRPAGMQ